MPSYSGKLLRALVNKRAKDLGLTWEHDALALGRITNELADELDRMGELAVLVPMPRS